MPEVFFRQRSVRGCRSQNGRRFRGERINVVVGDGDPSAKWAKALADKSGAQIDILPETDYLFSGKSDEFAALPEKYLF